MARAVAPAPRVVAGASVVGGADGGAVPSASDTAHLSRRLSAVNASTSMRRSAADRLGAASIAKVPVVSIALFWRRTCSDPPCASARTVAS